MESKNTYNSNMKWVNLVKKNLWIKPNENITYDILSLDLVGSSKIESGLGKENLLIESVSKIFLRLKLIAYNLSIKNEGVPIYWAGDGGAFIFEYKNEKNDKIFKFAKELLNLGYLYNNYEGFINQNVEDIFKDDFFDNPNEVLFFPRFRIVIHSGSILFNDNDPSVAYGDALSYVLKYERELGLADSITITSSFRRDRIPNDIDVGQDDMLISKRQERRGSNPNIFIHPMANKAELLFSQKLIPFASILNGYDDLKKIIFSFFEIDSEPELADDGEDTKEALIYNIGLRTFQKFSDLWEPMLKNDINIKLLLIDEIPYNGNEPPEKTKTKEIITGILKNAKVKKHQSYDKCTIKFYDDVTMTKEFENRFGFSIYKKNTPEGITQIEGTNFYLIEPLSKWIYYNKKKYGIWKYKELLYFSDEIAFNHLSKYDKLFINEWDSIYDEISLNELIDA